jgi:6-phosphogluconolactonase
MKTILCSAAISLVLFQLLALVPSARAAKARDYLVYIGTYTKKTASKGIYVYRFNSVTGKLTSLGVAGETTDPSFVAVDPTGRFLYSVNEMDEFNNQKGGAVSAFAINRATGKLKFLNEVSSHGTAPCYVAVDKTGRYVMIANYGSGSVVVFRVRKDGGLGTMADFVQHKGSSVNPARQKGPHAHMVNTSTDNRFALSCDLGLDKVLISRFDAKTGKLTPDDPSYARVNPGSGPRHFVFSPNSRFVYVISEIGSTVTVFSYNGSNGAMRKLQTISTIPKDFKKESDCAEIAVLPSGKFLYGSNRGHDSIAVFAINQSNGTLTPVEYVPAQGKEPRSFAIDPTGSYLFAANQDTNNLVIFRINPETGRLTPTGQTLDIPAPVCVLFVPAR